MRLWKNLFGTNGEDKIHPDEIGTADYVVEVWMDDVIGYRKWNSGLFEQWLRVSGDISNGYDSITADSLTGHLTGGQAYVTLRNTSTSWLNIEIQRAIVSSNSVDIGVKNNSSSTANVTVQVYMIGRWK